jgi:predicted nucleotidyltransferase
MVNRGLFLLDGPVRGFALVKRVQQGENEGVDGCSYQMMNRDLILLKLRRHAPELKEAGLVHLRVFGSVARGEANAHSDVDLLADFDKSRQFTLVTVGNLETRLADLLGVKVELSSADWMREPVRQQALREAVLAF